MYRALIVAVLAGCASAPGPLPVDPVPRLPAVSSTCPNVADGLITRVNPLFPKSAIESGQTGWVIVSYDVAPDGSTTHVRVAASSPPGVFDKFAVQAIRQWKYRPGAARENCVKEMRFNLTP